MKLRKKQIFAILMAFTLSVSLLPTEVSADESDLANHKVDTAI